MSIEITKIDPCEDPDFVWVMFEVSDAELAARLQDYFITKFRPGGVVAKLGG